MVVLALDTATRAGSCAVARDGGVLRERAGEAARPHETRLPRDLMALLEEEHLTLGDVDLFAVAIGPGSFTGLRIGIATMQGLAFARAKPLVGVSAFDALASVVTTASAPPAGGAAAWTATWIDAWRGDVYAALYEDHREVEPPSVEQPAALLTRYAARVPDAARCTFIGDAAGTYAELIVERMGDLARMAVPAAPALAGTIARLAWDSARGGHRPPPHAIRPLYVRRPAVELTRDARPVR